MNTNANQFLHHMWQHRHTMFTYFLLRLAMISPFGGVNAHLHRLRGVHIGKKVRIAHDVFIDPAEPKSITLGDYVTVSPRVKILAHTDSVSHNEESVRSVRIGENTWICTGALILPGVTVGKNCVVGAGAVVTEDIPDFTLALGVPAKPVRVLEKIYEIPKNATLDRVLVLEDGT